MEGLHLRWQFPLRLAYSCGETSAFFFFLDSTINVTDKGVVLMESNQETHFAVHPPYYVLHLLKGIQLEEGTAAEQTVLHASMA